MSLTYKWLKGDELSILEPIIGQHKWSALNTNTSVAFCAFYGDKLIGFNVLQYHPVVGPLWVDKLYRGVGIPENLADSMAGFLAESNIGGYLAIADSPESIKLCESHGMRKVESPVYQM